MNQYFAGFSEEPSWLLIAMIVPYLFVLAPIGLIFLFIWKSHKAAKNNDLKVVKQNQDTVKVIFLLIIILVALMYMRMGLENAFNINLRFP